MLTRILKFSSLALLALILPGCLSLGELSSLGNSSASKGQTPVVGSSSHFICWNVHKADSETFTKEIGELLDTIPDDDGAMLCLQEVRSSTFDLIKGLHREEVSGHYAPSWRFPFSEKSTGVLTIGNQALPKSGAVPIRAPRRELYVASPKVSLSTKTPLSDDRNLQVINCHGLNFVRQSVFPQQLDKIFGELKDSSSPAIVCGDFNVWSEARLELLNQRAKEHGFTEATPRGEEHSPAPKWMAWMGRLNGFDPEIRLDRIYTRGIEVEDCYSYDEAESSDHRPLVLRYKVLAAP